MYNYRNIKLKIRTILEKSDYGRQAITINRFLRWQLSYLKWLILGKPLPIHQWYKIKTLKSYAKQYNIKNFIETGTLLGDTTAFVASLFNQCITIELDKHLYEKARRRFQKKSHISVCYGDSAKVLPQLMSKIEQKALFWLDAHYTGGMYGKGEKQTPIIEELCTIFAHHIKEHIILIDDARLFTGQDDYPTLNEIRSMIGREALAYRMDVKNDIIRIVPQ